MEIQEEMEIEEYFGYFTPAQRKYIQAWVEAWKSGREVKIEARDLSHAKSMQNMAYRVKEIVIKDWREKRMVPKGVVAAIRAVVPAAGNDGLSFRERKTGKIERPGVREGGWREVGVPTSYRVQAPAPALIPASIPAPAIGNFTDAQARAALDAPGYDEAIELAARNIAHIPSAGELPYSSANSNAVVGMDMKAVLASYKAKPRDPSVGGRVSKGMYGDSEPTSEFPTEDELLNAKGNGNDE